MIRDMPCYFIETNDGDASMRDGDGHDFKNDGAARIAALAALPDMARDKIPDGDSRTFSVSVRNEHGRIIYKATMSLKGEWCG